MRSAVAGLIAAGILTAPAQADPLLDRYRPTLAYSEKERDRTTSVDAIAGRLSARDAVDLEDERPAARSCTAAASATPAMAAPGSSTGSSSSPTARTAASSRPAATRVTWELLQLRVGADNRPDLATLAQHSWAEGCAYGEITTASVAALVFVANGSHALYSRQGTHDRQWPDPDDEADGRGRRVRPPVEPVGGWVRWPGRWGDSEAGVVPGEQSSPRGPAFQERRPWQRPSAYHADHARDCGAKPPRRAWQWPTLIGILALTVVLGIRRATYNRPS
jgi:hypothetical protein